MATKALQQKVKSQLAACYKLRFGKASDIMGLELTANNDGGSFQANSSVYTFNLTKTGKVKVSNGLAFRYYGSVRDAAAGIAGVGA